MATVRTTLEDVAAFRVRLERPLKALRRRAEPYAHYDFTADILASERECEQVLAELRAYIAENYGSCEAARKKQGKRERVIR